MANDNNNRHKWLSIGLPVVSAIIAVLGTVYVIGQRTGKISEVVDWKKDTAPRIERMESEGTTSFKLFHDEYLRRQVRQEDQLDKMQREIHDKEVADMKERLLTLERKPCPCLEKEKQ